MWSLFTSEPHDSVLSLDQKLVFARRTKKFPSLTQYKYVRIFLNIKELSALYLGMFLIGSGVVLGAYAITANHVTIVPFAGGTYREGIIGQPAHISPFYSALNPLDEDIATIIFSPLEALTKDYTLNGSTLTVTLKDALFHDNTPVTAQDVVFTYTTILNKASQSPLRDEIAIISKVEAKDAHTVVFTLTGSTANPKKLLSIGIAAEHVFAGITPENMLHAPAQLNPIGSGPYRFESLERGNQNEVTSLHLTRFDGYTGKKPYIKDLEFRLATTPGELADWYTKKEIDAVAGLSSEEVAHLPKTNATTYSLELPEYTAIFFNQIASTVVGSEPVRDALASALDPQTLVSEGLMDNGTAINTPLVTGMPGYESLPFETNVATADALLEKAGWKKKSLTELQEERIATTLTKLTKDFKTTNKRDPDDQERQTLSEKAVIAVNAELILTVPYARVKNNEILHITLTVPNHQDSKKIGELIAAAWGQIGVMVTIDVKNTAEISTEVLPKHHFEALLLGVLINTHTDPYALWYTANKDSSVAIPRFNDAYVDELINKARSSTIETDRENANRAFAKYIVNKKPAIILYRPTYEYVISSRVKGVTNEPITSPSKRFEHIASWYVRTTLTPRW